MLGAHSLTGNDFNNLFADVAKGSDTSHKTH